MTFLHRALLILALTARLGAQPTRLELGKTVEAELAGGQTHQYVVTMSAGQFARIVVSLNKTSFMGLPLDAHGTEEPLELRLSEPSQEGASLALHWPRASLPKSLFWVAKITGTFRVELTAGRLAADKYLITLEEHRGSVVGDSTKIEVQQLFERARSLNGQKQYDQAIKEWERALPLVRQLGSRDREEAALESLRIIGADVGGERGAVYHGSLIRSI